MLAAVSRLVIAPGHEQASLAEARALFVEYAESLGFDLSFQGFDAELADLPGCYAPPGGRLLLARWDGALAGCIAARPLCTGVCEMKRLYVRPSHRQHRVGRALTEALIASLRQAGYRRMRLDTVPSMVAARSLYASLGFRTIEPYRHNPIAGAAYLELDLVDAG